MTKSPIQCILFVMLYNYSAETARPEAPFDPAVPAAVFTKTKANISEPPKPVFDVRTYGAKGDGETYDTAALQKAVDACAGTGGSVYLSKGNFLTANLTLKGGMTLYIAKDAALMGGTDPADYPIVAPPDAKEYNARFLCRSLLYAYNADKLRIDGGGTIDARGAMIPMNGKEETRPSILRMFSSDDVIVRNVTLKNARMWTQVYVACDRLLVERVAVRCPAIAKNLDGIDIVDCHDAIVRECEIDSEDDLICLKTQTKRGLKNILIENNFVYNTKANGIKIGTHTAGPIENVRIVNNVVKDAKYAALCVESVDGSAVRDVLVRGLEISNVSQPIFIRLSRRNEKTKPGSINGVRIERVRATAPSLKKPLDCISTITGIENAGVQNVLLKDIFIEMPGGCKKHPGSPKDVVFGYPEACIFGETPAYAFFVRHAEGVVFENVTTAFLKEDVRPWLVSENAKVEIKNCSDLKLKN